MEKFSEFNFDIKSNKNSPQFNNNDNNIYNSTNINIRSTTPPFSKLEYYMLSNLIISYACKKYYTDYKSVIIPQSYIAFYFKELSKYTTLFTQSLKKFLKQFNKTENNLDNAINIFIKTFSPQAEKKEIRKVSFWNDLKPGEYIECKKSLLSKKITYEPTDNIEVEQATSNIQQITNKINQSSYDKNLKYLYIDFLSNYTKTPAPNSTKQQKIEKKQLVSPPKEKKQEKITKIKLPKLSTHRIYPISFTHSRIDSAFFAHKFLEGYKAFTLVEKYRFKEVRYTTGYEEKRKSLFEVKKSDFDLF